MNVASFASSLRSLTHCDDISFYVLAMMQTLCSTEEMLERRLVVLNGILESEEVYLRELETLLMVPLTR